MSAWLVQHTHLFIFPWKCQSTFIQHPEKMRDHLSLRTPAGHTRPEPAAVARRALRYRGATGAAGARGPDSSDRFQETPWDGHGRGEGKQRKGTMSSQLTKGSPGGGRSESPSSIPLNPVASSSRILPFAASSDSRGESSTPIESWVESRPG
jgi:hypothetical protein